MNIIIDCYRIFFIYDNGNPYFSFLVFDSPLDKSDYFWYNINVVSRETLRQENSRTGMKQRNTMNERIINFFFLIGY